MTIMDSWNTLTKEQKKAVYPLIGESFATGKRVSIPKVLYIELNKEQRIAVRYILDTAQDSFTAISAEKEGK